MVDSIVLEGKNPYAFDTTGSRLYISMSADWFTPADEGVETVDLIADTSMGYLCDGSVLGGAPTIIQTSLSYLYVAAGWPPALQVINRTTGVAVGTIAITAKCMIKSGATMYVGDSLGVGSINTVTNTLAAGRIRMSMPPYSLAVLE